MKILSLSFLLFAAPGLFAQGTPPPATVARLYEGPVRSAERDIVSLAEAMPASAYSFAPKDGQFKGVRTFAQQVTHAATVLYVVSAGILGEKSPVESGTDENGAASLTTKEQVVQYLKDAFTYGRKAMQSMTAENQLDAVPSPFGPDQTTRGALASEAAWHSFDHYGQMVVYARMNGIVPPASPQPVPPATKKK